MSGLAGALKSGFMTTLRLEHTGLIGQIDSLQKYILQLHNLDQSLKSKTLPVMLETLSVLQDRMIKHMRLEERRLYTLLPYYIDPDLVDLMIKDHRNLATAIAKTRMHRGKRCVTQELPELILTLKNLLSLKKEHLRKEREVVFWLAEVKTRWAADSSLST